MSDGIQHDAQVIIVGGGPVGMGLAIELGQRGIRCVVVERYTSPQPIPKGQNLTQRTMEHLYFWGAEQELRAARTIPREFGIGGLTAYGTLLGAIPTTGFSGSSSDPSTSRTTSGCRNMQLRPCSGSVPPRSRM
jgi:glycine/D-amino acid oxidase-like deaminating enzyme